MTASRSAPRKLSRKKISFALLAIPLLLVLGLISPKAAFASSSSPATATLICDESGETENVVLLPDSSSITSKENTVETTYEISVYSPRNASYTLTGTDADSSLSVRGYLTICYTVSSDGLSALLTRVRGYWTILDQSVSVTKASVRYGCTSLGVGYGQAGERVVDNNFSFATGFGTYAPISASSIGANLELKLKHGSSNWTLVVDSTYVNNVPGVISLDD